jgi:hypothetical protein
MRVKNFLAAAGLLLVGWAVQAQEHCRDTDTFQQCSERLANQLAPEGAVVNTAESIVAAKNTGDDSTSTINDFLPLLRAVLETGGFSSEEGDKLGFEWSNPLGLPAEHQNKLSAKLTNSELYQPLEDALRAASLADQVSVLEDKIDEGDDISFGFSYSRASERYGRDPSLHAGLLSGLLKAVDSVDPAVREAEKPFNDLRLRLQDEHSLQPAEFRRPFRDIPISDEERAEYMRLAEAAIRAQHPSMRALGERLDKVGFYGLLDLINNQPQWSVTAEYHARDETVGPDEFRAQLSYEMGWVNVNSYRDYERRNCSEACVAEYLSQEDVIANLKASNRITFKAEYSKLQRLNFTLPGTTPFAFSEKPVERFGVTAALGRYLGKEVSSRTRARVDASIGYEDFSDDPSRQDRGLATVTFSYPVSEGFYLSVGAIYATKPEFRGDVDEELSARAGFTYKVIQAK